MAPAGAPSGGGAQDQVAVDQHMLARRARLLVAMRHVDAGKQHVQRPPSHLGRILLNRRQRRPDIFGQRLVVVPGHAQVAVGRDPDFQAGLMQSGKDAEGDAVVAAQNHAGRKAALLKKPRVSGVDGALIEKNCETDSRLSRLSW